MKDMLPFPINRSSEKDAHLDFAQLKETKLHGFICAKGMEKQK
jgi:hypothetical protein